MTLEQVQRESTWNGRMSQTIINGVTTIAFVLALLGLYAVTMYGVAQRTHELGVRTALGAPATHIARLVLRRVIVQLLVGIGVGIACTILWSYLFIPPPSDPTRPSTRGARAMAVTAVLVTVVGLSACLVPARRAVRTDPLVALRME
jgi:putative ABC transport system permease protein